uniref:Uncharacterized protein n=1 Tax=Anguilla anguilla TaxID=7936 RepID=A0A0E9VFW3_ANGAN
MPGFMVITGWRCPWSLMSEEPICCLSSTETTQRS